MGVKLWDTVWKRKMNGLTTKWLSSFATEALTFTKHKWPGFSRPAVMRPRTDAQARVNAEGGRKENENRRRVYEKDYRKN